MSVEIKTEILINANPEKVWAVLTDFRSYPNWNPFITSLTGDVAVGNKITVHIEPPGASASTFKPKVLSFIPHKEVSWLGQLLFAGVFDGLHKLELTANPDNTTTLFKQRERFSGILVPFFRKQLENNTKKGFQEMNQKLKQLVESK